MMYTMPKNLLSICVNFTLATQPRCIQLHGCIQQHLLYRVCYDPVSVDAQSAGVVFALSVVLFGIVE